MADIINSSGKDSLLLMSHFKELVNTINRENEPNIISPITITLGDEFQGITTSVRKGIELIFMLEETIVKQDLSLKLRYVLTSGKIDTEINTKIAHGMLGPGLTNARKQLNNLKGKQSRFLVDTGDFTHDIMVNKGFELYQSLVDDWKPKDLKIISAFFKDMDYKVVAESVNLDKSSVWRRKKSLKMTEYQTVKEIILYLLK